MKATASPSESSCATTARRRWQLVSDQYYSHPPERRPHGQAERHEAGMFYSVYDRGQVRMGRWARIDLDMHANRGFVGIIIGYTEQLSGEVLRR